MLRDILRSSRRIAVVGLSANRHRPSHGVAAFLQQAGYTIVPVNPAGGETLGEHVYPDLQAAAAGAGPIDIVNIFRRPAAIPDLVDGCIAVHPKLVWMQLGVQHDESARRLEDAGILVVMNRCLAVDYRALGV